MLPPAKKIFGIPHICLDKIRKILYNIFCCFTICDRGGIGIRARLRGVSSNGYGFKSRRSHIFQSREKSRFFHFHQEYQAWHDVLASIDAPFETPCSFVFCSFVLPKIRHEKHTRSCWLRGYFSVLIYLANFLCLSPPPPPTDQSALAILTVALSNRWVPHRACWQISHSGGYNPAVRKSCPLYWLP